MSLGSFKEASRTAIIIAREEQNLGNYRNARDILLDNYKQLRTKNIHIPAEMERTLMLLHSYILVKVSDFRDIAFNLSYTSYGYSLLHGGIIVLKGILLHASSQIGFDQDRGSHERSADAHAGSQQHQQVPST
jgi:hypothetical protein